MSGRALSRAIDRSEKYVRERIKDVYEFSLNDVENFCGFIGIRPEAFIGRLEGGSGSLGIEGAPPAPVPIRPDVAGTAEDGDLDEERYAADTEDEGPDEGLRQP